jgi:hypothetical protein
MDKTGDGLHEGHDTGVAEAQRGGPLTGFDGGPLKAFERILGKHTLLTDALDFKELAIDLMAELSEMWQVLDPLLM